MRILWTVIYSGQLRQSIKPSYGGQHTKIILNSNLFESGSKRIYLKTSKYMSAVFIWNRHSIHAMAYVYKKLRAFFWTKILHKTSESEQWEFNESRMRRFDSQCLQPNKAFYRASRRRPSSCITAHSAPFQRALLDAFQKNNTSTSSFNGVQLILSFGLMVTGKGNSFASPW